ncbi:MAG: hypothetical protein H7222_04060 [Methylotenera sp.]|nr:hypothetical protein [Oligoflexia bacterium]
MRLRDFHHNPIRHSVLVKKPEETAPQISLAHSAVILVVCALFSGCIADSNVVRKSRKPGSVVVPDASMELEDEAQPGVKISFNHSNFYTLTHPNSEGCAGDARLFTHYLTADSSGAATQFSVSSSNSSETYKPTFLKNVAVDLTDSNANVPSNQAYTCSYGSQPSVAPPSSCSTFDYGAIGGIPTSLGGSILTIGGNGTNDRYSPAASCSAYSLSDPLSLPQYCSSSIYALGVDSLSSGEAGTDLAPNLSTSDGHSISTWANLTTTSTITPSSVPLGAVGSAITYDPGDQKVLLFGGASPLLASDPTDTRTYAGSDTVDTWTYDVKTQSWLRGNPTPFANNIISTLYDITPTTFTPAETSVYLGKAMGARALFGYAAVPNSALSKLTTTGILADANVDKTERIVSVGGFTGSGVIQGTYRFNPTFGPDWVDISSTGASIVHWLDSYHTQLMSNTDPTSRFQPAYPIPAPTPSPTYIPQSYSFGSVPTLTGSAGQQVGSILNAGGFEFLLPTIPLPHTFAAPTDGKMTRLDRRVATTEGFSAVPNTPLTGVSLAPVRWTALNTSASPVDWVGGVQAVPGFSKTKNDFAYFGGSYCQDYLTSTSGSTTCFASSSKYYQMGAAPGTPTVSGAALDITYYTGGAMPATDPGKRAGMAVARGLDPTGKVIIVAWGGMNQLASTSPDNSIWVAYDSAGSPVWRDFTPGGDLPLPLANGQLVFSHTTGKFYLFGGYQTTGTIKTVADTYELSVGGPSCTSGGCAFTWKKLTSELTCYPNCPSARRSHRMVEVNYNNEDPTHEVIPEFYAVPGAVDCTAAKPCSFGIFMEGGSPDGFGVLSDRWMFDPTGNGGKGHWQRVDSFPPRRLAALASADYESWDGSGPVHRAVLFGGETALQNSSLGLRAMADSAHVAPTLGDTYVYDYDVKTWQRVELLGKGYNGAFPPAAGYPTERDARQAYSTADLTHFEELSAFSPPALSGAMMITRTMSGPQTSTVPAHKLRIPEVFLLGGRLKDGKFNTVDQVYKFCMGSTGERSSTPASSNDASCDAYDPNTNPNSTSGNRSYVGRWLKKNTIAWDGSPGHANALGSYMGAGAYDSYNDLIVFYGGLTSATLPVVTAVTNTPQLATNDDYIYEYTPPSKSGAGAGVNQDNRNGVWTSRPMCSGGAVAVTPPTFRYGHGLSFDTLNKQLIIVGGYNGVNGTLLKSASGAPEVWSAKRINNPQAAGYTDTTTCYAWELKTYFGNDPATGPQTGLAHAASVMIPSTGYNSGFYTFQDEFCPGAGPAASPDPSTSKLFAGGAYLDIDRSQLGPHENLLLHLTYIPMGTQSQKPDGSLYSQAETAVLRVHLLKSGSTETAIRSGIQPRHLISADPAIHPKIVQTLHIVAPPTGSVRQDQIVIPLTADPNIDRIRIERVSGSAVLIDATLIRMGYR